MIIFTPIKQIPEELLEMKGIKNVITYNLSSYYAEFPTLDLLIPSTVYISEDVLNGDCCNPQFDIECQNYILGNDGPFMQFMNIIIPAYTNPDTLVQVLINTSEFRDVITEFLLKFIQQRYGYNAYLINDLNDFIYAEESDLSVPGLFAMDADIQRWQGLAAIDPSVQQQFYAEE